MVETAAALVWSWLRQLGFEPDIWWVRFFTVVIPVGGLFLGWHVFVNWYFRKVKAREHRRAVNGDR